LEAVIPEAGGSACVVGHSSGAIIALKTAPRRLSIKKVAVYEPPFIVDTSRPPIPSG
jgi:alpha-beta hydrolase superfamily lysophospholipase